MNAIALGAVLAGVGVAAGAFGAHGLEGRVEPRLLEVFETGARYQTIHALALVMVGLAQTSAIHSSSVGVAAGSKRAAWLDRAGWLFVAGIILFAGSLYLMTFTNQRWLGAVTPFGGVAFLLGWVSFATAAVRSRA